MNKQLRKEQLRALFEPERVFGRLLAAWTFFIFFLLIRSANGAFTALSFAQDTPLGLIAVIVVALFVAFSVVFLLLKSRFETDSWFLLLGATACVCQWANRASLGGANHGLLSDNTVMFWLAVAVVYVLFLLYVLHRNEALIGQITVGKRGGWLIAVAVGVLSCFVMAYIGAYRYLSYSTPNFDFGLFCNMFHYMKETGLPLCTSERDVLLSHFVVHISPVYYLLLPFYALFPSPLTLEIGQAVVLASGVIPVLLLARQYKLSGKLTAVVCVLYALYPALSCGTLYDIHENCFLPALLLWMFYFFERNKPLPMFLFMAGVLMVKEDAAIYVMLFALYALLGRRRYWQGGVMFVAALVYFFVALAILEMTSAHYAAFYAQQGATPCPSIAGPMIDRFGNLIYNADDGLLGVIKTAILNPGFLLTQLFGNPDGNWNKVIYVLELFLPLGFLPFCTKKPSRWLLLTPVLLNTLTNAATGVYQYQINFQYSFGVTAFLTYAMIVNLPELKSPTRRTLLSIGAAATLTLYIITLTPQAHYYRTLYDINRERFDTLNASLDHFLDEVPADASIAADTFFVAKLSRHDNLYDVEYHEDEPDVDYVVLDARAGYPERIVDTWTALGYVDSVYSTEGFTVILQKGETP